MDWMPANPEAQVHKNLVRKKLRAWQTVLSWSEMIISCASLSLGKLFPQALGVFTSREATISGRKLAWSSHSKNHQAVELGKDLQRIISSNALDQVEPSRSSCLEPHADKFWVPPRMEITNPLDSLYFLMFRKNFWCFSLCLLPTTVFHIN